MANPKEVGTQIPHQCAYHFPWTLCRSNGACMDMSLEAARNFYAQDLRFTTRMASPALFAAFASVPRERFVGPGPWRVLGPHGFFTTDNADPRNVYHNVLIALDETKSINNGQPSMWARFFDRLEVEPGDHILHLGCGTGYYSAILAEIAGPQGKVTAVEIDEALAERARVALAPWPQVTVQNADGSNGLFDPVDILVASAGATHPQPAWLSAINPDGKLLLPLAPDKGAGAMALLTRKSADNFAASLSYGTLFIPFTGACDPAIADQLAEALARDQGKSVKSLRLDPHTAEDTCWLHTETCCFSTRDRSQNSNPC